ncbi:MAG TPA: laminin B domain-containing protein [Flavobacteriales bacterium]|nr:laminin B domain-containing protein [Flavobacteriales bacterium]
MRPPSIQCVTILSGCALLSISDAVVAQVSNFSTGTEAWTIAGDGLGPFPVGGGNPGGCISASDLNLEAVWYWAAPCGFLGNKSASYGQSLHFDRMVSDEGPPDPADVMMEGGGITIGATLVASPTTQWISQSVPLFASAWHRMVPGYPPITTADMQTVLGDLNRLWIKGEYSMAVDVGWLDNVVLEPVGEAMILPPNLCEGDHLSVQGHSMINPIGWQWSFPGGIPSVSYLQNPPSILYDLPGIYPVQVVITNACTALTVELGDLIVGKEYVIDTAISICYGTGYPFDGYVITEPGSYFGMLETYLGCDSAVTVHIIVLPELFGEAAIIDVACPGLPEGSVAVVPSGGSPPYTLELTGRGSTFPGPGPFEQLYASEYVCTITDASACVLHVPCPVDEPEAIALRVQPTDTLVEIEDEFVLNTACNYPVLSYLWEPATGLSCTDCATPTFSWNESSGPVLYVTVQVDEHECDANQPTWIEVRPRYFVANAFTPDGDSYNDEFRLIGSNLGRLSDFQAAVFDRWGNKVFESGSPTFVWDGRGSGDPVPPGVYAWFMQFEAPGSSGTTYLKGHVTVVR